MIDAALHISALVSGYAKAERERRMFAMLQGFGDDTGKGQESVFALGGLVAPVERWGEFSIAWDAKLKEEPAIRLFKARDAAGRRGEFSRFLPAQRDKKVSDLISIINDHANFYVGCAIDKEDWAKVFDRKIAKTMDSPFFFSYMRLITASIQWMRYKGPFFDKVEWIFDEENLTIYLEVLNWWMAQKNESPHFMRKRMGNHPIMRNDKEFMPLQAADLVVWIIGKMNSPLPTSIAQDWANQITVPGVSEFWHKNELAQFFEGTKQNGADGLEYETGKQRSGRLEELFGRRR